MKTSIVPRIPVAYHICVTGEVGSSAEAMIYLDMQRPAMVKCISHQYLATRSSTPNSAAEMGTVVSDEDQLCRDLSRFNCHRTSDFLTIQDDCSVTRMTEQDVGSGSRPPAPVVEPVPFLCEHARCYRRHCCCYAASHFAHSCLRSGDLGGQWCNAQFRNPLWADPSFGKLIVEKYSDMLQVPVRWFSVLLKKWTVRVIVETAKSPTYRDMTLLWGLCCEVHVLCLVFVKLSCSHLIRTESLKRAPMRWTQHCGTGPSAPNSNIRHYRHASTFGRPDLGLFSANRVRFPAPGFSHVGIVPDDAADRLVFSWISRFPPPSHSGAAPYVTLKNRFTPLFTPMRYHARTHTVERCRTRLLSDWIILGGNHHSPPSALTHSRLHSSVSHPLVHLSHERLTRRRPAISSRRPHFTSLAHTRQTASIKDCRPLGCSGIHSVLGLHLESSPTRVMRRGGLRRQPVSPEHSCVVAKRIGNSNRREGVCDPSKSRRCRHSRDSQKGRRQPRAHRSRKRELSSLPDFGMLESCRRVPLIGGFSRGISRFSRFLHSSSVSYSSPTTLMTLSSQDPTWPKYLHSTPREHCTPVQSPVLRSAVLRNDLPELGDAAAATRIQRQMSDAGFYSVRHKNVTQNSFWVLVDPIEKYECWTLIVGIFSFSGVTWKNLEQLCARSASDLDQEGPPGEVLLDAQHMGAACQHISRPSILPESREQPILPCSEDLHLSLCREDPALQECILTVAVVHVSQLQDPATSSVIWCIDYWPLLRALFILTSSWPYFHKHMATVAISTLAFRQGEPDSIPGRVTRFSDAAPYSLQSPSSALKTSLLRAAQIYSLSHGHDPPYSKVYRQDNGSVVHDGLSGQLWKIFEDVLEFKVLITSPNCVAPTGRLAEKQFSVGTRILVCCAASMLSLCPVFPPRPCGACENDGGCRSETHLSESYGRHARSERIWSGIEGVVQRGEADVAFGFAMMTSQRTPECAVLLANNTAEILSEMVAKGQGRMASSKVRLRSRPRDISRGQGQGRNHALKKIPAACALALVDLLLAVGASVAVLEVAVVAVASVLTCSVVAQLLLALCE
ncbi:hypothetical protein PR048_000386 [Dryococelus australis]|uniref:Uncharacterized protein n=1 Tax=Dryococelus australis TaxID=614101 RepID=A0ABQ9IEH5_9NEOP|nr:hypothetical protein PR048_000386 [Dryococelus australis]